MRQRVLLVSPVYNEASSIERVVRSVVDQRRPPDRWIIVDDGSTDGTLALLRSFESEVPFLSVLETARHDGMGVKDRLSVALEARAFNRALRSAGDLDSFTHIGKLDGDVELPPEWFEMLLTEFAQAPGLGIAGGGLRELDRGRWARLRIPPHHVHGATKLYSRECLVAIGGVQERLGWDTIDETYARMRGYRTWTVPGLEAAHLRPRASADGQLRGRARIGECAWIAHYPAGWVLARSVKVASESPRGLSGLAFVYGYARAAARRVPRVDDASFRSFTRRELRARVSRALRLAPQSAWMASGSARPTS